MRQRINSIKGTLNAELTSGSLSISGAALAGIPTLTLGDDYYPLTVDGTEIVYVTVHSSAATTATIVRGKESTTDVTHASGASFVCGPTSLDFMSKGIDCYLDFPKHTPHAMDDEFDGGADGITLDPKWTAVETGTVVEGTIDPYASIGASACKWEILNGSLWVQQWGGGTHQVQFRQDACIVDGQSIIMKCNAPVDIPVGGPDSATCGMEIGVNDDDSDARAGTTDVGAVLYMPGADYGRVALIVDSSAIAGNDTPGWQPSKPMYLRLHRYATDKWVVSHSHDGRTWLTTANDSSTLAGNDNTWMKFDAGGTLTVCPTIINRVDWVRVGSNNINPW